MRVSRVLTRRSARTGAALAACGLLVASASASASTSGVTQRVSVDSGGTQATGDSHRSAISADGRYVAYYSEASNLVAGDTNGAGDVFVHDRVSGQTERVSVDSGGTQANNRSFDPAVSADGRYVAYASYASNLVAGDSNDWVDVFVRDRVSGQTERVSEDSGGTQANNASYEPAISADGRYVAYTSYASNLVAGDSNDRADVFVRDRISGQTDRASVDSSGTQASDHSWEPAISADGRDVAYASYASNLVAGDTNNDEDVFVRDRVTGQTERVSVASGGTQANLASRLPAISADGRHVAYQSVASDLVAGDSNNHDDVFVRDRVSGQTDRVSVDSSGAQANLYSVTAAVSADGRYVAYYSIANNLVAGDTNGVADVFVHDRVSGQTERVSVDSSGAQANGWSLLPSISADGRYVAYYSLASNLVAGDTNNSYDVFVYDRGPVDVTPPAINAVTPGEGTQYEQGATINANYACSDEPGGSGLASCQGTVPSGEPIDTSASGAHVFTISAADNAGNSASQTIHYTADDKTAPQVSITSPAGSYNLVLALLNRPRAHYACLDNPGGSGLASCTATADGHPVANGAVVPIGLGSHTVTATGTDNAGNKTTTTIVYTITLL